jgi:hypothetical protein
MCVPILVCACDCLSIGTCVCVCYCLFVHDYLCVFMTQGVCL